MILDERERAKQRIAELSSQTDWRISEWREAVSIALQVSERAQIPVRLPAQHTFELGEYADALATFTDAQRATVSERALEAKEAILAKCRETLGSQLMAAQTRSATLKRDLEIRPTQLKSELERVKKNTKETIANEERDKPKEDGVDVVASAGQGCLGCVGGFIVWSILLSGMAHSDGQGAAMLNFVLSLVTMFGLPLTIKAMKLQRLQAPFEARKEAARAKEHEKLKAIQSAYSSVQPEKEAEFADAKACEARLAETMAWFTSKAERL